MTDIQYLPQLCKKQCLLTIQQQYLIIIQHLYNKTTMFTYDIEFFKTKENAKC